MKTEKYRIVEWTRVFADGSQVVAYELQSQIASSAEKWVSLGTSRSLTDARKALLLHAPDDCCGFS